MHVDIKDEGTYLLFLLWILLRCATFIRSLYGICTTAASHNTRDGKQGRCVLNHTICSIPFAHSIERIENREVK